MDGFCVCMIADLIGSRTKQNSEQLDHLARELTGFNQPGKGAVYLIPPTRRAGDELFLVAGKDLVVPALRMMYHAHLHGMPMYVGLGAGWAQDLIHQDDADRAQGPMIFRAADALKQLKAKPDSEVLRSVARDAAQKPAAFRCNVNVGAEDAVNRMVTGHLLLLLRIVQQRGDLQRRAVALKRQHPDQPARTYAAQLWEGQKEQPRDAAKSFSKHLMRAEYALVDEMADTFVEALARCTPKGANT
ncbi:MAG: hypothetical protein GX810_00860 [Clostridiales bacterium]|nr:hypothetical protein [Clostridiales bacterium]